MIDKLDLVSIISKYHLGGMIEPVRWNVKDGHLGIGFTTPSLEMIGRVDYKGFPLEDSTIAFSKTSHLVKLIAITNGYINLEFVKQNVLPIQLVLADNQYTLNYGLSDLSLIPNPGELEFEPEYEITAELDNESIAAIVKAKQALSETDTVVIKPTPDDDGEDRLELCFGGNISYQNKVSFYLTDVNITDQSFLEHYDSNMIKEIMYCNKDMTSGKMSISSEGLMKLEFQDDKLTSCYYIVSKEKPKER
jgi:hypothetical protein